MGRVKEFVQVVDYLGIVEKSPSSLRLFAEE